ncbi:MAG TPA: hypothetical protein VGE58_06995 [Daejeonella sp.]
MATDETESRTQHWIFNIPFNTTIYVTLAIILSVAPPFIFFYHFHYSLFKELEFFKLLVLTTSIGALLYAFNYIYIYAFAVLILTDIKGYAKNGTYFHAALLLNVAYFVALLSILIYFLSNDALIDLQRIFRVFETCILTVPVGFLILRKLKTKEPLI